jgi:hypothetical protein
MSDEWIREQADRHKAADEAREHQAQEPEAKKTREEKKAPVDPLQVLRSKWPDMWAELADALRRKANVYNAAYGKAVIVVGVDERVIGLWVEREGNAVQIDVRQEPNSLSLVSRLWLPDGHGGYGDTALSGPEFAVYGSETRIEIRGAGVTADEAADQLIRELIRNMDQ